ncbi:MAG: DNA mismatch repair protein MutT [Pseudomonadota bacterium]
MIHKACPIGLHPDGAPLRVAAFVHPKAGLKLVEGPIEPGELPARAAARALFEGSGLETKSAIIIGESLDIARDQHWHFALCRVAPPVRDRWQHFCKDDGGRLFKFFWQDLNASRDGFDEPFRNALDWITKELTR